MSALPTIHANGLPGLAYAHPASHDVRLTQPDRFRPIVGAGSVKPASGGLWTAPVLVTSRDGEPADTSWLEWCRENEWSDDSTHLTRIVANPDARVLRIAERADLAAIVAAHPASHDYARAYVYPDWPALAADWDAVYLTDGGQWSTRMSEPGLYGWDCATVLWLRPAYSVGQTVPVPAASLVGASS